VAEKYLRFYRQNVMLSDHVLMCVQTDH